MSASKVEIERWIQVGINQGATHLIVACDTNDYDNYPIFVSPEEDANIKYIEKHNVNKQQVDEVYDLSADIPSQLAEFRAMHLPPKKEKGTHG